ncbi:TrmH family RNA methyltransferase [Maribacter sp. 2307ULW6-5]|uniref:TrmH family RNA methyltransferase n=1 Tax=Maribacter sp. 2307ULW6-5 TaxID=3386275 RepID=UPI0039BD150E
MERALLHYLEGFISEERKNRFKEVLDQRTKCITVAMEDVYQLHNTSAVIRSCDIFGIQEAHVIEGRNRNRLDGNIAMGAQQWVDVHRYGNSLDCVRHLRERGYQIVATTPHEKATLLSDFELREKVALFFGTERDGLTQEVMATADGYLKIPMRGFTQSFNISVAAAIILQDLSNKLLKSDLNWPLTDREKFEKRLDWTKKSIKDIDFILQRFHAQE